MVSGHLHACSTRPPAPCGTSTWLGSQRGEGRFSVAPWHEPPPTVPPPPSTHTLACPGPRCCPCRWVRKGEAGCTSENVAFYRCVLRDYPAGTHIRFNNPLRWLAGNDPDTLSAAPFVVMRERLRAYPSLAAVLRCLELEPAPSDGGARDKRWRGGAAPRAVPDDAATLWRCPYSHRELRLDLAALSQALEQGE